MGPGGRLHLLIHTFDAYSSSASNAEHFEYADTGRKTFLPPSQAKKNSGAFGAISLFHS